jgi:hypothetical protein
LELEDVRYSETPTNTDQKKNFLKTHTCNSPKQNSNESVYFLCKGPGNGQLSKTENFETTAALLFSSQTPSSPARAKDKWEA